MAATLLAHTVPVAGLYMASEERADARELFLLCYITSVGLLASAITVLAVAG